MKRLRKAKDAIKSQHIENLARGTEEASVNGDLSSVYKIMKELITVYAPIKQPTLLPNCFTLSSRKHG